MDDPEDIRTSAEDAGRRLAAAITGAIEGFVEALDEHDLGSEAAESFRTAGEVARAGSGEAIDAANTPEMRKVGEGISRAAQATGQAAGRVADTVGDAATAAKDNVKETAQDVKYTVQQKAEDFRESYQNAKEEVKVRAEAVAETSRRATKAPGRIAHHYRKAIEAWWHGLLTSLAMMAAMLVFGIVTLVVLEIALVVGLNKLLGDPAGTWVVVAIDVVAMLVAWAVMRTSRARARAETRHRIEKSKDEVRHVVAPVHSAFTGRGRTGF